MVVATSAAPRLRREDCRRTNHDSILSKWQVLIGPRDWEEHASGKEGSERYRTHSLPARSCPGIYELGVADAREARKLDALRVIAVYVGQADSVRTRLQHYGRAGSHLDRSSSIPPAAAAGIGDCLHRGPGFFKDIFARGFSILYRWAPMKSKKDAENAEALLLGVFDYAWNRIANGGCRRDDILFKLESISLVASPFTRILRKLQFFKIQAFNRKRVGIKIEASGHLEGAVEPSAKKCDHCKVDGVDPIICGVTMTDGSVCRNKPVSGRKRCLTHKGMRVKTSKPASNEPENRLLKKTDEKEVEMERNCHVVRRAISGGVALHDGSVCTELPSDNRNRCQKKSRRRRTPKSQAT